jgi:long-chain acyl-CoA synthetase
VGKAFPSVMVKISDDGELLAKGKNIMRQYHNLKKENIEIFDDGYLKTGDLAEIDEEGFIKLSGRKKELFKTSNGKYVNPIHIEQKLIQELGFLTGAIIIAENRQFVSTLLFPEMEVIDKFKNKFKFSGNYLEFLQSELLEKFVNQKISAINQKLNHWEQIQKFKIISEQISIESGDITPSMKLKRKVLNDKYAEIIDNFYKN